MSANPHFRQTLDAISVMYVGQGEATEAMALAAVQAQATLALAYEARTANLIAMWNNPETTLYDPATNRQVTANIGVENADSFLQQIMARLGVPE